MAARADRMTSLDAAFYYLERTGQLLHVAGVYTVDGKIAEYRATIQVTFVLEGT